MLNYLNLTGFELRASNEGTLASVVAFCIEDAQSDRPFFQAYFRGDGRFRKNLLIYDAVRHGNGIYEVTRMFGLDSLLRPEKKLQIAPEDYLNDAVMAEIGFQNNKAYILLDTREGVQIWEGHR